MINSFNKASIYDKIYQNKKINKITYLMNKECDTEEDYPQIINNGNIYILKNPIITINNFNGCTGTTGCTGGILFSPQQVICTDDTIQSVNSNGCDPCLNHGGLKVGTTVKCSNGIISSVQSGGIINCTSGLGVPMIGNHSITQNNSMATISILTVPISVTSGSSVYLSIQTTSFILEQLVSVIDNQGKNMIFAVNALTPDIGTAIYYQDNVTSCGTYFATLTFKDLVFFPLIIEVVEIRNAGNPSLNQTAKLTAVSVPGVSLPDSPIISVNNAAGELGLASIVVSGGFPNSFIQISPCFIIDQSTETRNIAGANYTRDLLTDGPTNLFIKVTDFLFEYAIVAVSINRA